MKKICLVLAAVLLAVTLVACLSACKTVDGIILWWPSGRAYQSMINDVLARFKQQHPDAKITVQYKDIDAFEAYKYALNDDKTRPDVAIIDHVYVQALARDNQILNLKDEGAEELKDKFPQSLYNANVYKDGVYALPMSANTVVLMVNRDILKKCGVESIPTTFDELIAACEKVEESGEIAFAQPKNSFAAMEFASYVSRNGGEMISADGKTALLDSDKVVKALQDWKRLSKFVNTNEYEESKFYNGKVAFVEMGSWSLPKVTGSSKLFDCGFYEMVTIDPDLPNYSGLGLYSLCVARKTRDKELAVALAEFLATDKTVQLAFNKEKKLFPVTNEALADDYYANDDAFKVFASQLNKVTPRPATPVWQSMESAIVNMLFEVVGSPSSAAADIKAIAKKYQDNIQAEINRQAS